MNTYIKAALFGSIFGLIFGSFEFAVVAINSEITDLLSILLFSVLSLGGYITLLLLLMRSAAKAGLGYGQRFLIGLIFSVMIGVVYGIISGTAGFIFAETIFEYEQEAVEIFDTLGIEGTEDLVYDRPTPLINLVSELFGSVFFNALVGSLFSLGAAGIFRVQEEQETKKSTKKESKK
jgi:hypothetical protein